jgi:hypothetical protein
MIACVSGTQHSSPAIIFLAQSTHKNSRRGVLRLSGVRKLICIGYPCSPQILHGPIVPRLLVSIFVPSVSLTPRASHQSHFSFTGLLSSTVVSSTSENVGLDGMLWRSMTAISYLFSFCHSAHSLSDKRRMSSAGFSVVGLVPFDTRT